MTKSVESVVADPWLNNMNNCYILFDPERKETMAKMSEFINTKIDPTIILSCFLMNTHKYIEDFKITDKFIEDAIKKFITADSFDRDLIDTIRSLVFCGKDLTTEPVFIHLWTTIVAKFLPTETDTVTVDVVQELNSTTEQAISEVVN